MNQQSLSARLKYVSSLLCIGLSIQTLAQSSSFGNLFVHAQGSVAIHNLHAFRNGAIGALPGIIGTERVGANSYVSFVGSASASDASDATHVDGYARKYGIGAFTFPIGDNGKLRTCSISSMANATESTAAAYFKADPNTAITSNLAGGNYTALPAGAPFNTRLKASEVGTVGNIEYWDIDGASAVELTLTYDAASAIGTLTSNDLSKLSIAGWNGTQWVLVPSTATGTLSAGTIKTNAAITPNTYNIYTFAARSALCAGSTAPTLSGTTLSNTCPTATVNLNSLVTSSAPAGARLRWHTVSTNPSVADSIATPHARGIAGICYAYYFDATQDCYSPASAAVTVTMNPACADADSDSIVDNSDLDDDNDGILDKVENQCPTLATWTDWTSIVTTTSATGTLPLSGGNVTVTYTSPQVYSIQGVGGSYFNLGDVYAGTMPTSGIEGLQALHGAGTTHTYTFSQAVKDPIFVFWSMNGNTFTFNQGFSIVGKTAGITSSATTLTGTAAQECNATIQFSGTFTSISYTSSLLENWTGVTIGVQQCQYGLDSDSDGIANILDLDSDNDGCSDAYEGGATSDKTANFKFTGAVGTNGLHNSLETVADNGILTYNSSYTNFALDNAKIKCSLPMPNGVLDPSVWLRADAGTNTTVTGANIAAWQNQGLSGGAAGALSTCTLPTFTNGVHNFNPAIRDISTSCNGALALLDVYPTSIHRELTTFVVKSIPDVTQQRATLAFTQNRTFGGGYESPWIASQAANQSWFWWSGNYANAPTFSTQRVNNQPFIEGFSMPKWESGTHTTTMYLNGTTSTVSGGVNASLPVGNNLFINADSDNNNPSGGDLSEIIAFDRVLSATETNQVQTYLAIKYGLTLLNTAGTATANYTASDSTVKVWNIVTNAGYNNNIAGIAKDSASALNQKQSKSINTGFQPIIGIGTGIAATNVANSNAFGADKVYELIGDNGASANYAIAYAPTSFTPASAFFRMSRIWKVQETGTVGTVTIRVPTGAERLLVSNTNAFTPGAGTQELEMTTDGAGNVTAQVDLTNGQFFTFGRVATGPGGVVSMAWWFEGNQGVTASGNAVTEWEDQSLNGLNVTQATAGKQPIVTNYQNFNRVVSFASNKALQNAAGYWKSSTGNTQYNVFAVAKHTTGTGSVNTLFTENTNQAHQSLFLEHGGNAFMGFWGTYSAYTPFPETISNAPLLVSSRYNTTGNVKQLSWNGKPQIMTGYHSGAATAPFNGNNSSLVIGNHNDQGSWPFEGNLAEMVMYPNDLNATQRQQVESYLALKWGITLDQSVAYNYLNSNGLTIWDATANSGYKYDITGIGADAAADLNQKQSQSANGGVQPTMGLTRIDSTNTANTAAFTVDKSFMIWGSDNGTSKFYTPITAPASHNANHRFNRIWKVQETGTVGTVQFAIPSHISGGNTIYLVRSTDATFNASDNWTPLNTVLSVNGVAQAAANVDFTNGEYFTLATYVGAPGCVAGNLNFWLKADGLGDENGAAVAEWENQAISGLDSVGQVTASSRPTFHSTNEANLVNFNPSLSFDGGDELTQSNRMFANTAGFTQIAVAVDRRANVGELRAPMGGGYGNGNFIGLDFQTDGNSPYGFNPYSGIDAEWVNATPNYRAYSLGLGATNQSGNIVGLTTNNVAGGTDNVIAYVNGSKDLTTISANQNAAFGNGMYVGSSGDAPWLGLVPEVLVYDKQLTDAEMQRIYTYLAIKYGVTLNQPYINSSGTTIYDTTGYAYNIGGIGREVCQTLNQKQSRSMEAGVQPIMGLTSIETTNSGNGAELTDGSFMIWGSNNNEASFSTPISAPAGMSANNRFARAWKVQETGTVGTIKFAIPKIGQGNTVYLLRSNNATFDATDAWIELTDYTVGNTNYLATDIDFNNGDYFTIASYLTGPGCVAANLNVWLKADNGTSTSVDGAPVWSWANQSLAGFDSVAQVTASVRPTFYNQTVGNMVNFNPSLSFDGGDQLVNSTRLFSNTAAFTTIAMAVDRRTNPAEGRAPMGLGDGNFPAMDFQTDGNSPYGWNPWSSIDGEWVNTTPNYRLNALGLGATNQNGNIVGLTTNNISGGNDNFISYVNGAKDNTTISANQNAAFGNGIYVGSSGGEQWLGLIPEVLVYDRQLTDAEMQRVYSYLAIKYGTTLKQPYLSGAGVTIYDTTGYAQNIAGIGREICQGLNQKQSQSANTGLQVTMSIGQMDSTNAANTATITDGSFMLWGNDAGAASFGTPIAPAAGTNANNRFTRVWKIQETGTVGMVQFAVPSNLSSGEAVYLVRSTDATFNASDEFIPLTNLTVGSKNYLAASLDFNNGDYFTLATHLFAPGCVTSGLDFWLDPARNVTKSGSIVTDWSDADGSGNNPTLTQATAALQPEYSAGDVLSNFNPYINFSGSERLNQDVTGSNYSNNHTTFGVVNQYGTKGSYTHFIRFSSASNSDGGTHSWGLGYPDVAQSKVGLHYITAPFAGVAPGNVYNRVNGNKTILQNVPTLYSASVNATTGATAIGHNGNEVSATGITGNSFVPYNSLTVGGGTVFGMPDNKTQEIIHYSRELTVQERQRVQTYLAIKHGITLDNQDNSAAITEGDYILGDGTTKVWNYTANAAYHNNVFGIGKDDCQGLNQKQSISISGGLTLGIDNQITTTNAAHTGAFDTDASFLMAGDNNLSGVITPAAIACTPPSSDKRLAKIWKVVETGTVENVKVQIDLSGTGFNANYPVYMLVADDAGFTTNAAMIPMTGVSNLFSTNYDFNGTKYISFSGNTTPLANLCTGDKQLNWYGAGNWWNWGERSKTITQGDQTFTVTIADAGNNILYPTWYPVSYGNSIYIPRYDNDNTGKVTFKVTMSKPATAVSFPIYGVDWHWGLDKVTVLGKLSGGNVTPKLSKAWYSWVDLTGNEARGRDYLHGGYSFLSTTYVNFDAPIDEFTVEYVKTTTYPTWKIYNYIGMGAIDVACAPVIPEVVTPDNVYVFKQATPDSAKAGMPMTFKYTVQNLNCDSKTINLTDNLPAGLTYVDSTLATSLAIGSINNYGSAQNVSLSNITVPKGTSYIYIGVKGSSAGTYSSQANFTVTGGGSYTSDDPKQSGSNNPTRVVILAGDPAPNLAITKTVNKARVSRDSIITYTYTIANNGATAINTYLEDALYSAATFVSGSLSNAPAGVQLGSYGNTSTLLMRDLNIAAGAIKTFSIQVNVGQMAVDSILKTSAKITPDYQAAYQPITTYSNAPQTQIAAACSAGVTAPVLSGTTLSNACPATTVNLNSLVTSATPSDARLRWHTVAANPTAADSVATPSARAAAGTFYAYYFDATQDCYSPATAVVTVTINACAPGLCTTAADNESIFLHRSNAGNRGIIRVSSVTTSPTTTGAFEVMSGALSTGGITISKNLNGGSGYSFYAVNNFPSPAYHYYNGSSWTATTHLGGALNPGGGTNYIFNYTGGSVTRYDGTGNATTVLASSPFAGGGYYDIAVDSSDNFYLLSGEDQQVKKYDANGTLLTTFTTTGVPTGNNPGFACINGALYCLNASNELYKGTLSGNTFTFALIYTIPGGYLINDLAGCPTASAPLVAVACNAGASAPTLSGTTITNTCPATTVNLNSLVTSVTPSGARLRWHTVSANPTAADSVATPSARATAGTFYAYYFDEMGTCYSPASASVTVTLGLCTSTLSPSTPIAGGANTGNAATDLNPQGGTAPYTYSVDNTGACVSPGGGAQPLPASSNLTVNGATGAYSYTTPALIGTYYYCIKVCDNSPTPICKTVTYTVNVACGSGTATPTLSATTATNSCPAMNVNLGAITASNLPAGARLTWHTATPATLANKVADSSQIVTAGTYYASFYDFVNGCMGNGGNSTTAATVTINTCNTSVQLAPKAFLSGSYVSATGMMYDSLRVRGFIPSAQPYTSMGYTGSETVISSVLATTGANAIVDWVLIQLRSDSSTVVAQKAALIQRDGDIVSTDGVSPLTFAGVNAGNYYVVVKHRNHLGVMTANALALTSSTTTVDFTIAATPNFQRGGNFGNVYAQRTIGSVRTLWSGNTGGGNTVKATGAGSDAESTLFKVLLDIANVDLLPTFIVYNGYFREDGNLDGKVIYQGSGSETDMMLFNVLLHGSNVSVLANYIIYEQIP